MPPSCQTYEGGIAGEPSAEAHGGYVSKDGLWWFFIFFAGAFDL